MDLSTFYYSNSYFSTDKGTSHDYIASYYSPLFTPIKDDRISILEIGTSCGSALLFSNWFKNGNFIGVDIQNVCDITQSTPNNIEMILSDAYTFEFIEKIKDRIFDFIIDDGPHTLDSQLFFIENFYKLLKKNGRLIVEDIQTHFDLDILIKKCEQLKYSYKIFDLRQNKKRYDDLLLEITKQ